MAFKPGEIIRHIFRTIAEPERLAARVRVNDDDPQEVRDFLEASISKWLKSPEYLHMVEGQQYFENKNLAIMSRKRTVIGRNGEQVEAPYLANNRLPHAFMRKMTKQKIAYLLSKPFTITSSNEAFQEAFAPYIDKAFLRLIKNTAQDAVVAGKGWIQPYYNEAGELKFKRLPPTEIRPYWKDIDHTELEAAVRVFELEQFTSSEEELLQYVKYFTRERVLNYMRDSRGVFQDELHPEESNFQLESETETVTLEDGTVVPATMDVMWERIPLVCIKYNPEEDSLLKFIKPLIDDYDRRTSDLSNVLEDEPDKIKVVKDYDGTDKGEFMFNLSRYRTLFLRGSGDVKTLDTSISADALEAHLTRTRRDIFESGNGVDTQNKDLGNASGVALRFVYSDLDMDCTDFGAEIAFALEQLMWFIKQDLLLKTGQDFTDAEIEVFFNTDITINESETITNIKNSVGIVSNKTLLAMHPYVTDVSEEEEALEAEHAEAEERLRKELELTNPTVPTPAENGSNANPTANPNSNSNQEVTE